MKFDDCDLVVQDEQGKQLQQKQEDDAAQKKRRPSKLDSCDEEDTCNFRIRPDRIKSANINQKKKKKNLYSIKDDTNAEYTYPTQQSQNQMHRQIQSLNSNKFKNIHHFN